MEQFLREFGPLILALAGLVTGLTAALKVALPRLTVAFIEDRQKQADAALADRTAKREAEIEEEATERQTQITLLSQFITMNMATQKQNEGLIRFITETLRADLNGHHGEILTALRDIDQRWIAVGRELTNGSGKAMVLTSEVVNLSDRITKLDTVVRLALNGNMKNQGD